MKIAIFPGSFDPFTIGHYSIVTRSLVFVDEVVIAIGVNEAKRTLLPPGWCGFHGAGAGL